MSSSRTKQAKNAGREWFAPAHAWECVYQIGEQESIEVSILCIYICSDLDCFHLCHQTGFNVSCSF